MTTALILAGASARVCHLWHCPAGPIVPYSRGERVPDFVSSVALTIIGNIPHGGYAYAMFFTIAQLIIEDVLD
jgi:hypothetical protein